MKRILNFLLLFTSISSCLHSQSAFVSSSAVATSPAGTTEYTLGQLSGEAFTSESGAVCHGVNVPIDYQTLQIVQGKNFIARSVFLADESFSNVLNQQITERTIERIEDNLGGFLIPSVSVSSLSVWNPAQSYSYYSSTPQSISLSGTRIIPSHSPIALRAGWNLVPYNGNIPINASTAFSSIAGSIALVVSCERGVYCPVTAENTLEEGTIQSGMLLPGKGYAILANADCVLSYPIE